MWISVAGEGKSFMAASNLGQAAAKSPLVSAATASLKSASACASVSAEGWASAPWQTVRTATVSGAQRNRRVIVSHRVGGVCRGPQGRAFLDVGPCVRPDLVVVGTKSSSPRLQLGDGVVGEVGDPHVHAVERDPTRFVAHGEGAERRAARRQLGDVVAACVGD